MNAPQFLHPDEDGVLTPHPLGLVQCTNDEYHSGPGISKSHLDAIAGASPRHYWHKYINPNRERNEPTPALILGSAIHSAILEPDLFPREYVQSPTDLNLRTNAGKAEFEAFKRENEGKTVLRPEDWKTCIAVRDSVWSHPVASGLLADGFTEQSFYAVDEETGELIKCRTDFMSRDGSMIVDLKSTEDASPAGFGKSASNFRYTIQPAWYYRVLDGAIGTHPDTWVFLAVEKSPPYALGIYYVEHEQLERARIAADRDFMRIVECKRAGHWPDYGASVQSLQLPAWSRL